MRLLNLNDIIPIYFRIDKELFPLGHTQAIGRPPTLNISETVTVLVWNVLAVKQKTLKSIFEYTSIHLHTVFPRISSYRAFLDCCHRALPLMLSLLSSLLAASATVKFVDSTMIPVCRNVRAGRHKVSKGIAQFGKNHQGWHFGFKMHTAVNQLGQLTGTVFTPANIHDAQVMIKLINHDTKIVVGDSHYGASVIGRKINELFGTQVIAPPHYSQKKKILTKQELKLLQSRPIIESVFGYLKGNLHLVTSFPRSVQGYFLHYVRILLGYQIASFL
jgi:Transposase DDE domain